MTADVKPRVGIPALLVVLMLGVMACCPTPAATFQETSFAATVEASDEGLLRVRLADGSLALVQVGPDEQFGVGDRLYVEGVMNEGRVLARRVTSVSAVAAGSS